MKRWPCGLLLALVALAAQAGGKPSTQRIVTLAPHLAELVCAAGACNQLVGVGAFTNYPPAVERVPVLSDVSTLNYEFLLKLRPTRVYVWDGGTPAPQLARLKSLGLPVVAVRIDTLEEVASTLRSMGQQLGHAAEGAAAAERYLRRINALKARYAKSRKLKVFYQIETSPAYTVNGQSPISQVIALCGGVNVFASLPTLAAPVSVEAVLAQRPEVVLHSENDRRAIRDYWRHFEELPLVHFDNFYGVNADLLTRSGPRLADGAEAVCEALESARTVLP